MVPVGSQVGLGTYFTARNVTTQALNYIHLGSSHVVSWWVVVGWLVCGDSSKWHRLIKNRHLVGAGFDSNTLESSY